MNKPQMVAKAPAVESTTVEIIHGCLEAVINILETFGLVRGEKFTESLAQTITHWERLVKVAKGSWMKVAKYKLAAFYSFHRKQPIPIPPWSESDNPNDKPGILFSGSLGRWLSARIKGADRQEILQSIKQSKKGMPRPTTEMLKEEVIKFNREMTEEQNDTNKREFIGQWADYINLPNDINTTMDKPNCEAELRRTVVELFRGKVMTIEDRIKEFFPSTSANYINNQKNAGAVGTILEHATLLEGLRKPGGYLEVDITPYERQYNYRAPKTVIIERHNETKLPYSVKTNEEPLKEVFAKMWWRLLKGAITEENNVKAVALAEALKIRIITKGPPLTQTVLRNHWKYIHTVLRQHKAFKLIGEPVTEEYVLNQLGKNLGEEEVYISGDYKAATDNLKCWVSEVIADQLALELKLSGVELDLFKRNLTRHIIDGKLQTKGQLMGSIVSFPILCIANATICRWALELCNEKKILLKDALLMINGDDCAMKAKPQAYTFWRQIAAYFGMEESVGKTYVSKEFVDINSTSFERQSEPKIIKCFREDNSIVERETYLVQTKYVNAGLLMGIKRSGEAVNLKDQTSSHNNIAARARQMLRLAPENKYHDIMKKFINYHRDVMTKTRLPWFIPEWLGGIGLPIGTWGTPSELDLRLARKIIMNWNTSHPNSLSHNEVSWMTWNIAEKLLPEPVYASSKDEATEEYTHTVATKCIDILFDSNFKLEDIHQQVQAGIKIGKAISKNAKFWTPKPGVLPMPMTVEEITFQARYPNWVEGTI
jgi:hypothetical protein